MQIIISGIINSGKSACAKALLKHINNPVLLEIDLFFNLFPDTPLPQAGRLCVESAAEVAAHLSRNGFNIIIPFPFYKPDLDYHLSRQPPEEEIHFFTLAPDPDVIFPRRKKRPDAAWEWKMVQWQLELNIHNPGIGVIIDNTNEPIEKTVNRILSRITAGDAIISRGA